MKKMTTELIAVSENQVGYYRLLLDVLKDEKKALVGADPVAVNAARFRKESILSRIHDGDEKLKAAMKAISAHLGIPLQGLSLRQVSQRVEAPFSLNLIRCAEEISSLTGKIRQENEINMSLITHSLKMVRSSMNLIVQLMTPPPVYFQNGNMCQAEVCGVVLSGSV